MFLNYYEILGVGSSANTEEIKRAFRIKAKLLHPDVNDAPDAHEKFRQVNEAYEVLIDAQKRYLFDLQLNSLAGRRQQKKPQGRSRNSHTYHASYSSAKADPNFHYDWNSMSRAATGRRTPKPPSASSILIYRILLSVSLVSGILVITITAWAVCLGYWSRISALAAIPGIFMLVEGWRGLVGQSTWLTNLMRRKIKE
jgi:DnaJ-class molecular chaperone